MDEDTKDAGSEDEGTEDEGTEALCSIRNCSCAILAQVHCA